MENDKASNQKVQMIHKFIFRLPWNDANSSDNVIVSSIKEVIQSMSTKELIALFSILMDTTSSITSITTTTAAASATVTKKRRRTEITSNDQTASSTKLKQILDFMEGFSSFYYPSQENIIVKGDNGGGWIVCLLFMTSYDIFVYASQHQVFKRGTSTNAKGSCYHEKIIQKSVKIIQFLKKIQTTQYTSTISSPSSLPQQSQTNTNETYHNVLSKCFEKQLRRVDAYITSATQSFEQNEKEKEEWYNDNGTIVQIMFGSSSRNKRTLQDIEDDDIDLDCSSSSSSGGDEDEENNDDNIHEIKENEQIPSSSNSAETKNNDKNDSDRKESSPTDATTNPSTTTNNETNKESLAMKQIQAEAFDIRSQLIDLASCDEGGTKLNLTSSQVQHFANLIINLLQKGGSTMSSGAKGVSFIGNILTYGITATLDKNKDDAMENEIDAVSEGDGDDDDDDDDNHKSSYIMPITDTLLAQIVSSFLLSKDGTNTSSARVLAFLSSFVIPVLSELNQPRNSKDEKKKKCPPASRILQATILDIAKDRPDECMKALLVPLCLGGITTMKEEAASDGDSSMYEPSQSQCELITKILKQASVIPLDCLSIFVSKVICGLNRENNASSTSSAGQSSLTSSSAKAMVWTEATMPILTCCFNRKPLLSDNVISSMCFAIESYISSSTAATTKKSVKFSAMFHAFVSKYGPQIQKISQGGGSGGSDDGGGDGGGRLVKILEDCAKQLKTFLGKTILSVLKKLK